jgi:hypothetical protein
MRMIEYRGVLIPPATDGAIKLRAGIYRAGCY